MRAPSRLQARSVGLGVHRSGWPLPPDEMRGAARVYFKPPRDMSMPPALRLWAGAQPLA